MTTAQTLIIRALDGAPPLTADALAVATGLPAHQVRKVIDHLRDRGHIASIPKTYALTAKGAQRAKAGPKKPPPPRPRVAANEDTVSHAVRKQHPLATVWGVSA